MSKLALIPPMSKSELEILPDELRNKFLTYIKPLHETISILLHSRDEDEFGRNLKSVTSAFLLYSYQAILTLDEGHIDGLLENYLASLSSRLTGTSGVPIRTHLEQTLVNANKIIANFIRLMIEPNYRDYVSKHVDVFKPYIELLVYTTILIYILDSPKTKIESPMAEKIIHKTQETAWNVESYVDTIEIDADPEASAALEHIKHIPF